MKRALLFVSVVILAMAILEEAKAQPINYIWQVQWNEYTSEVEAFFKTEWRTPNMKAKVHLVGGAHHVNYEGYSDHWSEFPDFPPYYYWWDVDTEPPYYSGVYHVEFYIWKNQPGYTPFWDCIMSFNQELLIPGGQPYNPDWEFEILSPSGEINKIEQIWSPYIEEEGTPYPYATKKVFRCYFKDKLSTYDETCEIDLGSSNVFYMPPVTLEGEYGMQLYIKTDMPDFTETLAFGSFEITSGVASGCPWDQFEIDEWLVNTHEIRGIVEEIEADLEALAESEVPEIIDDTATGEPPDLSEHKEDIENKSVTLAWADMPPEDPFTLSLPEVGGETLEIELQFDPRAWDIGGSIQLEELNVHRVVIRTFLIGLLTIYLARKIIGAVRRV